MYKNRDGIYTEKNLRAFFTIFKHYKQVQIIDKTSIKSILTKDLCFNISPHVNYFVKFTKSTLVDIKNAKVQSGSFTMELVGDVVNNTGANLDEVYLTFKMYDAKGKVLSGDASTVIDSLKAGETASFSTYIANKECKSVKISEVPVKSIAIN